LLNPYNKLAWIKTDEIIYAFKSFVAKVMFLRREAIEKIAA